VLVRSDGRPTYNFASPFEDAEDGITHVIRGDDHISNTPKQIQILGALGADIPVYAHAPSLLGADGKKLSKRHGAQSVEELRKMGYVAPALLNFLALLGWSYDDKTTIMSREELVERFSLDRVQSSPATFDYEKLDWMNGVYLRAMPEELYEDALVDYLRYMGIEYDESMVRRIAPIVQEKIERLDKFQSFAGFFFKLEAQADPSLLDPGVLIPAKQALEPVDPWEATAIEAALRALADELGQKPRQTFEPIRLAVTGSKISPGLFESLEVLGKDESLARLAASVNR
jgi:glutamyl-tRNA synthetase